MQHRDAQHIMAPIDDSDEKHVDSLIPDGNATPETRNVLNPTEHSHNTSPNERREKTEDECYSQLALSWPTWKKWMYLCSIAAVQISMNFNTSVFPNAVVPLSESFGISQQEARAGQMIYLVLYSFGCELWAPWSEELGRWPILQLSMFLINIWQIPCALAPNWGTIVVCRGLVSNFI